MRRSCAALAALSMLVAGCGQSAEFTAPPIGYLVTMSDLETPDFTVAVPASTVNASQVAPSTSLVGTLAHSGLSAAAQVTYYRNVGTIDNADGPIEIISTVARFSSSSGAHTWFLADVAALLKQPTAAPTSTGPLGDESAAVVRTAQVDDDASAVQITVVWRTGNLVNVVVCDGRYGGTGLDDALYVALRQQRSEAG